MFEQRIQVGLFLLFLVLPALDTTFDLDSTPRPSNQARTRLPAAPQNAAELAAWRDRFESYVDDSFGWRSWAVRGFNRLNYRLFRVSEQRRVVVGKDQWLYFGAGAAEYQRATDPFSEQELGKRGRLVERRRRWLAEQGIEYIFTVAPNKHSIYPEYLPAKFKRTGAVSRYEQLAGYLEAQTEVTMVDLHTPLLAAKQSEQVYERTGTHWNSRGAYIAYRALHGQFAQWLPGVGEPVPWERLQLAEQGPGELVRILGLEGLVDERRLAVVGGVAYPRSGIDGKGRVTTRQDDASLPRAVIFHDSFAIALAPYLAEHFSLAVFQWRTNFDGALVRQIRPDIVIEERVERNLLLPPFRNILPPLAEAAP